MKIVMMIVSSVNGKITKGENSDVRAFSSEEDAALFEKLKKQYSLIIMGRKTYEVAKKNIQLDPKVLRIVLTHNSTSYKSVPGKLEFTNETPSALVERLSKYSKALLVGGGEINALFLKEKLVNELYLTVEPTLFGKGRDLVAAGDYHISMELISIKKLNEKGTLLARYRIV